MTCVNLQHGLHVRHRVKPYSVFNPYLAFGHESLRFVFSTSDAAAVGAEAGSEAREPPVAQLSHNELEVEPGKTVSCVYSVVVTKPLMGSTESGVGESAGAADASFSYASSVEKKTRSEPSCSRNSVPASRSITGPLTSVR